MYFHHQHTIATTALIAAFILLSNLFSVQENLILPSLPKTAEKQRPYHLYLELSLTHIPRWVVLISWPSKGPNLFLSALHKRSSYSWFPIYSFLSFYKQAFKRPQHKNIYIYRNKLQVPSLYFLQYNIAGEQTGCLDTYFHVACKHNALLRYTCHL